MNVVMGILAFKVIGLCLIESSSTTYLACITGHTCSAVQPTSHSVSPGPTCKLYDIQPNHC